MLLGAQRSGSMLVVAAALAFLHGQCMTAFLRVYNAAPCPNKERRFVRRRADERLLARRQASTEAGSCIRMTVLLFISTAAAARAAAPWRAAVGTAAVVNEKQLVTQSVWVSTEFFHLLFCRQ